MKEQRTLRLFCFFMQCNALQWDDEMGNMKMHEYMLPFGLPFPKLAY